MWKVVSFFVYALDRVVDNPQSWVFDNDNSEVLDCLAAAIAEQDAVLLGRATYGPGAPSGRRQPTSRSPTSSTTPRSTP